MVFTVCPLCSGAVDSGSHWDCVFQMMADWVQYQEKGSEEPDLGPRPGEGKVENG